VSPQQVIVQEVAKIRGITPNNTTTYNMIMSESNATNNSNDGNNLNTSIQSSQPASTGAVLQRTSSNK